MTPKQVQAIRAKKKLSQAGFAKLLGVSVRTLQDWEQGRHEPNTAAVSLLRMVDSAPAKRKR